MDIAICMDSSWRQLIDRWAGVEIEVVHDDLQAPEQRFEGMIAGVF